MFEMSDGNHEFPEIMIKAEILRALSVDLYHRLRLMKGIKIAITNQLEMG